MTMQVFKARLLGATKGHKLLKKKRDALKARFHQMLKEIVATKIEVGTGLRDAAFAFAKAQWASGGDDVMGTVAEKTRKANSTAKLSADNVAGVSIPHFTFVHDATKDTTMETLGISHGGAVVGACRGAYLNALKYLVKLASLQDIPGQRPTWTGS